MDKVVIHKYKHGGGRIFIEKENGGRDLVADLYEPEERRNAIIDALIVCNILPVLDKIQIIEVG